MGLDPGIRTGCKIAVVDATGKLVATHSEGGLKDALRRLTARGGEPLIRKGVDMAMRLMGEQFVTGETIEAHAFRTRESGHRQWPCRARDGALDGPNAGEQILCRAVVHRLAVIADPGRAAGIGAAQRRELGFRPVGHVQNHPPRRPSQSERRLPCGACPGRLICPAGSVSVGAAPS